MKEQQWNARQHGVATDCTAILIEALPARADRMSLMRTKPCSFACACLLYAMRTVIMQMVTFGTKVDLCSTRRAETRHLGIVGWWATRWTFGRPINHDSTESL